jgi:hypothetical protein
LSVADTPYQLGLKYASNVVVNSAVTASYVVPGHFIELESVQDFNWGTSFGSPVTFSMWFKTNAPSGSQFNINISNYGYGTSSYNIPVIANSGVWQYITATIPPPPNGTTWVFPGTNGSIQIYIAPYNPGQLTASSSAWTSTYGLYGNYPWVSYAGTSIAFTGVQLEKGTVATPWEFRGFAQELALCQRYFTQLGGQSTYNAFGVGIANQATTANIRCFLPVPMRSPANATATGVSVGNMVLSGNVAGTWSTTTVTAINWNYQNINEVGITATVAGGLGINWPYILAANNSLAPLIQINNEL